MGSGPAQPGIIPYAVTRIFTYIQEVGHEYVLLIQTIACCNLTGQICRQFTCTGVVYIAGINFRLYLHEHGMHAVKGGGLSRITESYTVCI